MPWPMFQIGIRKALNFYQIKSFTHVSFSLNLPKVNSKTFLLPLSILLPAILRGIFISIRFLLNFCLLVLSSSLEEKKKLVNKIGKMSIDNCQFGDLIISGFLRAKNSNGTLSLRPQIVNSLTYVFLIPIIYAYLNFLVRFLNKGEKLEIILIIPETVRISQLIRRVIYDICKKKKIKLSEIYHETTLNKFILKSFDKPFDFIIAKRAIKHFKISNQFLEESWEILQSRLYGQEHVYAHTGNLIKEYDINPKSVIDENIKNFLKQKKPIIFFPLHQVADDQFCWGFDDFGDLNTFIQLVIDHCIKNKYLLIIKPHPMAFNPLIKNKYLIEQAYYKYLFNKYFPDEKINKETLNSNSFICKKYPNIIISSYSYPITKILESSNSKILTLTRHGKIILESLVTSTPCLFSSRSRFLDFNINHNFSNFKELIYALDKFNTDPNYFKTPSVESIKYLVACSILSNQKDFSIRSLDVLKPFLKNQSITQPTNSEWYQIFEKLNIKKFINLESTAEIIQESNDFSNVLDGLV